ncbi:pyridoxal phosphate homeostasis protein-like isoform X1 [Centruroides sculpturatus]|uniref:pyridoxal phosphate homeostasis protein-like isoform X1 n=2 Tax=Centruroides sculpturatus TaxID=218467 RepID=UPI000C6EAF2D|nr:pyridoxal phosphate homeostasis protein-like isoform X1 [Centruroides sculpturatus]XP_023227803.1 pyridoxal phosphate homeostasis protein-like isoform X1 [Centruroides sculpturatus]XP_023227804.1 pyridoxal phosphate homeostasis protein-like isoform X1 [Centruroides sculpturatus]
MNEDNEMAKALRLINEKIRMSWEKRPKEFANSLPRLVAVSKTKPKEMIINAYNNGQRHFGENYVSEIVEKANDPEIIEKCKEIQWHFIGRLQRNKINKLLTTTNLYLIETIDSKKLAEAVDKSWKKLDRGHKLKVMIQVNTSGEENKNGVTPQEVTDLVSYVRQECSNLEFSGLMTIGALGHNVANGPNPDFQILVRCRKDVCTDLKLDVSEVELSMGMSNDFEHAIELGSTNVRVGSAIFGSRDQTANDK